MKKFTMWALVALMLAGLSSCNDEDDESKLSNNRTKFIGTWNLVSYYSGWYGEEKCNPGEITVTFTWDGDVKVVNKRVDQHPIPTGTYTYSFVDVKSSIYTGEPGECISLSFGSLLFSYKFEDNSLYLSAEAFDGPGYALQKVKQ